jgi:signal transduction histidine kinase
VPLITRSETLGALTFAIHSKRSTIWGANRRYSSTDLALAEEVARRAAIAVDRARLHRQTERAVRARENILNIVSHDLRGPLNTLIMSAALLTEDLAAAGTTATGTKALQMIQRSAGRMERMVGDLLDTASIDSGRLAIVKEEQVLQALVEEAILSTKSDASRKSLQLEVQLQKQEIRVPCDRGRIVQVLSNLIGNAIKFTKKGGSIIVSAEPRETEIRVAVSDTGAGIEPAQLPLVFDRLFQANEAISIGTGLGLYISKGIIETHGGVLWVESELGKGSTFFFTLPST